MVEFADVGFVGSVVAAAVVVAAVVEVIVDYVDFDC